jgi:hypothetical protein
MGGARLELFRDREERILQDRAARRQPQHAVDESFPELRLPCVIWMRLDSERGALLAARRGCAASCALSEAMRVPEQTLAQLRARDATRSLPPVFWAVGSAAPRRRL